MADQNKIEKFKHDGRYLPECLRDFHDAKDVFKHLIGNYDSGDTIPREVDWTTGMCYVIDYFLWKMANYGYTLQKSRCKIDFYDLQEVLDSRKKEEADMFWKYIEERKKETEQEK